MIISNASPLIYLSRIRKLGLLKKLFKLVIIPYEVYQEVVVRGKKEGFQDVLFIEKAIEEGWIKVKETRTNKKLIRIAKELDKGEIEVISLAENLNPELTLIDDASARIIAESFGLNVKGTLYVILKAFKQKLITKQEVLVLLNRLAREGFRLSQELYLQILSEID